MKIKDKVAIITGTSSGVGAAVARRFLDEGALVVGVSRRSNEALVSKARFAECRMDLSELSNADRIVDFTKERFGLPQILVNNAGIGNSRSILETSDEDLERYLLVNFKAPFALSRAAIRVMRGTGGAIVNVASSYGLIGAAGSSGYAPSKAALINLTRNLAADYGRDGIRTNAVAPGTIRTSINEERLKDPWNRDIWVGTNPLGRTAHPDEVAAAILFLVSDDASFINGEILQVDGGWTTTKVPPRPRQSS